MPDLEDGQSVEIQGSAKSPYVIKNTGGVYSCTCPAWRNQSLAIERRTCKHIRKLRGDAAEEARVGSAAPPRKKGEDESAAEGPPLLLAHVWENDADLTDWWMSEKLDGVRAYWDGTRFLSRLGNEFHAPDWFVEGLPKTPLDGELWLGRKAFQRTVSIVRRQDKSDHWREVRYVVFDAPAPDEPFEERLKLVEECLRGIGSEFLQAHEHTRCRGLDHLREELARVESLGGEGLMLRQPGSLYEVGRSTSLLKVKTFHDAEAVVVDHVAGKGRHKGRLGALVVRIPDGTEFSVGTGFSDKQRETPPGIGSTITFRYQELSDAGVPRFPSFVRVRSAAAKSGAGGAAAKGSSAEPQATKGATSAGASEGTAGRRYFEFVEGKSSKFWEIAVDGTSVTVRFGRIGTNGQTQTKMFRDDDEATAHADKLIAEKTGKGYVEQTAR
jgi:DNA ligase-1